MNVFRTTLEEISLSGLEGCTLEELWIHLSSRQPPVSFSLDDPTKSYIWSQVLKSICPTRESFPFRLYLLPRPRECLTPIAPPTTPPTTHSYQHPFSYRFISDTSGHGTVRGSCTSYHERKDVTMEISEEMPSLTSTTEKYGNSLVMVASQELRERALIPDGSDPCLDVTDVQYGLLEVVGCARHHGISRPFVTSKYLKVDARSTFFYVKQLAKKGLINMKNRNRLLSKGRVGVVCVLFLSSYQILGDDLPDRKEQICDILSKSPFKCKPIRELYAELGKRIKPVKKELIESGHIEQVQLKDVSEEYANDPAVANLFACRLLVPYVAKETDTGADVEEDDEEGGGDSSSKVPLVPELPLECQGYKLIEKCGPAGIGQQDFIGRRGLDLTRFANRGIVKNLIKKSKVVAIIQDNTAVRTVSLVAAGHVGKNEEYKQLHAEALKSGMDSEQLPILTGPSSFHPEQKRERKRVKKESICEETPLAESTNEVPQMISVADGLLGELNVSADVNENGEIEDQSDSKVHIPTSRSVSPSTSTLGSESGFKSRHLRTFKQLKRSRIIMEYFERHRVVSNLISLIRHIRDEEHKDGQEHVLDSKTLNNIIARLVKENKLCARQVTLSTDNSDQTPDSSDDPKTQTITLHYIPQATEEEVATAHEAALSAFKSVVSRRALRSKGKKEKKSHVEGDSPDDELVDIPDTGSSSRFQRLRHFHCYLWILAYGHTDGSTPSDNPDHALHDDPVLSKAIFPWAAAVIKLPSKSTRPGWINFFDITNCIPLSLFLILARITMGKTPSRYLSYFQDEDLLNTTLCDLPVELKKGVVFVSKDGCRRDRNIVYHLLQLMEEMNLITIDGSYGPRDYSQLFVQLATSASILDTSTCKPRRSFFLNEARPEFTETAYTLACVADVERYWFDLQLVCQQTAIIIGERKVKGRVANPALQDTTPLVYHAADYVKKSDKDWVKTFNQRGFGAGGLPPLLFSHASRNWSSYHHNPRPASEAPPTSHKPLPGVSLFDLPYTTMEGDGYPEGGVSEEGLPLPKKTKTSRGTRVTLPRSQVVKNSGGKGRDRVRMKKVHKAVKTARKVASQQSKKTHRFKLFQEISKVIEDDTLKQDGKDGERRSSIPSSEKEKERASWTTEQGSYLLSSYLACCLLNLRGGPRVKYCQIREALQNRFPRSRYKIAAVKRHLVTLLKKRPQVQSTLDVRMAECLQEMEAMGRDAPEVTFEDMLEFIQNRSGTSKNILSQEILLPRSLEELQANHTIIGGSKTKRSRVLPVVEGESEVNKAIISDLILATLGADESTYDKYKTFKLFESFPERDVMAALDQLRQKQLIKRKKPKVVGIPAKQSPLEAQSYDINHNFYAKLEGHFPPNLLQDTAAFFTQLRRGHTTHTQPGLEWTEDQLRVHGDRTRATTAAALLGAAVIEGTTEVVRPILPEHLFEEAANPDQPDEEEMMDTSTQLLGEEEDGGSDGDDKEEDEDGDDREDDKEEDVVKLSLTKEMMRKLKYARGGVSTLFGVGAGPMKFGHVEVEPALSSEQLFESVQEEQNGCSQKGPEDLPVDGDTSVQTVEDVTTSHMTLDNYLIVAKKQLEFEDLDLLFSRELYRVIDGSGPGGVQRSNLEKHTALNHLQHSLSLGYHIQSLMNFDLVFSVGVSEEYLVTEMHSGRWNMSADKSRSHTLTPYRPWSALMPPHLNTPLLEKYQHGVLIHIMSHPGISLVDLMSYFSPILHVNGLREILQALEASNQIKRSRMRARGQCALFESGQEDCTYEYFEPVITNQ